MGVCFLSMNNIERILILAPHTDDGEFACGGTIARYLEAGKECYYVAFSYCDDSLPPGSPKGLLLDEMKAATSVLGIEEEHKIAFDYRVRHFPQARQEILEDMVRLNNDIRPDLVLLPTKNDTHQDHAVIAYEGFRAFKKCSMLGYELPWNNLTFVSSGFVEISKDHLQKKIEALGCYESQANRDYASPRYIESLAVTRGVQFGVRYAEAFDVVRSITRL